MIDPEKQTDETHPQLTDLEPGVQDLAPGDAEEVRGGLIGLLMPATDTAVQSKNVNASLNFTDSAINFQKV
jgi:hypothetical protein